MADYQLEGPKPARMYEVILPKKLGYFGKVQEVLEDLFDERADPRDPVRQEVDREATERTRASTRRPGSRRSARRRADTRSTRWTADTSRPAARSTSGCWSSGSSSTTRRADRTPGPISWPRRSRWSITWSRTGSPTSWASRRRSGSLNTISPSSPSGGGKRPARRMRLARPSPVRVPFRGEHLHERPGIR